MENKKIISKGDLKERIEKSLIKFNCIYDMDINPIDDPFIVRLTIDPKLCENYDDITELLNFINNREDLANVIITDTNAIKNIKTAFNEGKPFYYLLGTEEIKTILSFSYSLGKNKAIDRIFKEHENIHIFITEHEKVHRQ